MKTLIFTLSLVCGSCVHTQLKIHKSKLADLPKVTSRKNLYTVLPPLSSPEINPAVSNSSGIRGSELYDVDDKYHATYSVWYKESPTYAEIISNSNIDAILNNHGPNPWKIKANPGDVITNIKISRSR